MQIRRLNTLRAIAALIVLVGHYSNRAQLWDAVLGTRAPQLGVMLFFLLSAFLMSVLYIDRAPTAHAMRAYGLARFGRVVPLYVAVVVASWALGKIDIRWIADSVYDIPDAKSLASHLALMYGAQVLWTIPAEIHFYVIFAVLWSLRRRLPWAIPLFGLVVLGVFASGHWPLGPKQPVMGFPVDLPVLRGLPYFVAGMAIGMLYLRWQPPVHWRHHGFVAALGLVLLLYPAILERLTGWTYVMWFNPLVLVVMSLAFSCLVFLVPDGNPLLEHRVGDYLGNISYSLYLLHFPILLAMEEFGLAHGAGGLLLFLGITVLASTITYRFFEFPVRSRIRERGQRRGPGESTG
ncbi:MAG TPA: acyltransferase [Thermomonas sp.]|nr:acyltransferase [Thermomonas sp.]